MNDGVDAIRQHLNRALLEQLSPLFLEIDLDGHLVASRGDATAFGLADARPGSAVDDELPVLVGLEHRPGVAHHWSFVTLPNGAVCHVYAIGLAEGWGIALLDARTEHEERRERQQTAHELLLLRDERERLVTELAESNRLKSAFIARMSHEFRTPLASVIGYTDELRELRGDDDQVQRHLAAVSRGARHLLNLVENLLDQASLEIESLSISPRSTDVAEISDEIEQLLRPMAGQRQLTLAWWFDDDIPERVWLDPMRLKQVLINLVGNAIKFTRSGSVTVTFGWAEDRLRVCVEDTGPGIPEAEQTRVFEPFTQSGNRIHGKGAGLGLSISRALVEAMGGNIGLHSEEGVGSRFVFEVDARRIGEDESGTTRRLRDRRVLVVDDDPDMRELLRRYLSKAGCRVVATGDAPKVLGQKNDPTPDAVILDIGLGTTDGNAVARDLRTNGYRGRLVALSGNAAPDANWTAGPTSPFDAYWIKPMRRGELLRALADLLS